MHIIIILVLALVFFGPRRLPLFGAALIGFSIAMFFMAIPMMAITGFMAFCAGIVLLKLFLPRSRAEKIKPKRNRQVMEIEAVETEAPEIKNS
ncbi:MAG: hypothetical protein M0Z59_03665 [Nitrospiraceae bacterium]|nr:hypothetical protein [Nitrospiraceae bacterium]